MKKRIFCLICLSLLMVTLLAGCRCKPHQERWYVQRFQAYETFANGVTHLVTYSGVPSVRDPFSGMREHFVTIAFADDGTVLFQPGTGEVLTGTYTYDHNGLSDTGFTVMLDNGESFSGTAQSHYYGSFLDFDFRGRNYEFKNTKGDAEALFAQYLQELADSIRYWSSNYQGDIPVHSGVVTLEKGQYWLHVEGGKYPTKLDDSVAVRCLLLDADNQLHKLDAIREGECCCAVVENGDLTIVAIYYIEPVAEN